MKTHQVNNLRRKEVPTGTNAGASFDAPKLTCPCQSRSVRGWVAGRLPEPPV